MSVVEARLPAMQEKMRLGFRDGGPMFVYIALGVMWVTLFAIVASAVFSINVVRTAPLSAFAANVRAAVTDGGLFGVPVGDPSNLPAGGGATGDQSRLSGYTIRIQQTEINEGEQITVSWTAPSGQNLGKDWIGIYDTTAGWNTSFITWAYTGGTQSGSVNFTLDSPGTYEARYLKNDGFEDAATSDEVRVMLKLDTPIVGGGINQPGPIGPPQSGGYMVRIHQSSIREGDSISVSWTAPPNHNLERDWIGIYDTTAGWNTSFITWAYTGGTQSGTVTFRLDNPGQFEARYLKNDGFNDVAESTPVEVALAPFLGGSPGGQQSPSDGTGVPPQQVLAATPTSIVAGEGVNVTWQSVDSISNIFGWVGLYKIEPQGATLVEFRQTLFRSGDTRFVITSPGTYEVRYIAITSGFEPKILGTVPITVRSPTSIGTNVTNYPSSGSNIIAFGDSLVKGVGASFGEDFVSELGRRSGQGIMNKGVTGDTTRRALERLDRDVLSQDPKVVVVLLGGNDALQGIPASETEQNLRTIIDRIHNKGAIVILLGIQGGLFSDNLQSAFSKLASEKQVAYIPNILGGIIGNPLLMSDLVHPNDRGYEIMAEKVAPTLRALVQ